MEPESSEVRPYQRPEFPCLPNCESYEHHRFYHNEGSFCPFDAPPPEESPPCNPPHQLPPLAPNSSKPCSSSRGDHGLLDKLLVPAGCFLSQGLISSKPTYDNPSRATMVVLAPSSVVQEAGVDLISGGSTPIPVSEDMLEEAYYAVTHAKAHGLQINHRHPAQKVDFDRIQDIRDMISCVTEYHENFSDIMEETGKVTNSYYPFIPADSRLEFISVPDIKEGGRLPIVAQTLFGGKKSSRDEGSSDDDDDDDDDDDGNDATIITFVKNGAEEDFSIDITGGDQFSVSCLLKTVIKSLEDPEDVSLEKNDVCVDLMTASYMTAYRKLAKTTKKAKASLENVDGDKQTDFW